VGGGKSSKNASIGGLTHHARHFQKETTTFLVNTSRSEV
jgi:hypothetical protein